MDGISACEEAMDFKNYVTTRESIQAGELWRAQIRKWAQLPCVRKAIYGIKHRQIGLQKARRNGAPPAVLVDMCKRIWQAEERPKENKEMSIENHELSVLPRLRSRSWFRQAMRLQ